MGTFIYLLPFISSCDVNKERKSEEKICKGKKFCNLVCLVLVLKYVSFFDEFGKAWSCLWKFILIFHDFVFMKPIYAYGISWRNEDQV